MKAIIGGTGLNRLDGVEALQRFEQATPYARTPVVMFRGQWDGAEVLFLPRHGEGHRVPPHAINYRANIDALRRAGAREVVGVAAVGSMRRDLPPAALAVPQDIIDYTWGRAHTFCAEDSDSVLHVEFAPPYAEPMRRDVLASAQGALVDDAVLAVTQGPRLESAAEIRRLQRDGCDLVGMTAMPEAALAREAGLDYVTLAVVVNWAAGIGEGAIHAEIERSLASGMAQVHQLLARWLRAGDSADGD